VQPKVTVAYNVTFGGQKKRLGIPIQGKPSPFYSNGYAHKGLALADPEHFSATLRADALCRRFTVLHGYGLGVFHLSFDNCLPCFPQDYDTHSLVSSSIVSFRIGIEATLRIEQSVVQAQRKAAGCPAAFSVYLSDRSD